MCSVIPPLKALLISRRALLSSFIPSTMRPLVIQERQRLRPQVPPPHSSRRFLSFIAAVYVLPSWFQPRIGFPRPDQSRVGPSGVSLIYNSCHTGFFPFDHAICQTRGRVQPLIKKIKKIIIKGKKNEGNLTKFCVEGSWPRLVAKVRHCTYQESPGLHISSNST